MENINIAVITAKYNSLPVEITRTSKTAKEWGKLLKEFSAEQSGMKMTLQQYVARKIERSSANAKNRHDKGIAYNEAVSHTLPNITAKYAITVYPAAALHTGEDATFLQQIAGEAKKCVTAKKDASRPVSLFVRKSDGTYRQVQGGTFFAPKPLRVTDLCEIEKLVMIAK